MDPNIPMNPNTLQNPSSSTDLPKKKKTKKTLVKQKKTQIPSSPFNTKSVAPNPNTLFPQQGGPIPQGTTRGPVPRPNNFFGLPMVDPNFDRFLREMPNTIQNCNEEVLKGLNDEDMSKLTQEELSTKIINNMKFPEYNGSGIDMKKIFSTLMKGASKLIEMQTNGSLQKNTDEENPTDPPELPSERSGKYPGKEDLKQRQAFAKFNECLLDFFNLLASKLPHKAELYKTLQKLVRRTIDGDESRPWKLWEESTKDFRDKLTVYSKEHVIYICQNLEKIKLLEMLELSNEWHHFTSTELTMLWARLNQLQLAVDDPNTILQNAQKREHHIYKAFNIRFIELLDFVKQNFPKNASDYDYMISIFMTTSELNPERLMEWWKKSVDGHEQRFSKYSQANVDIVYKNIKRFTILNDLQLELVSSPQNTKFNTELWDKFSVLQGICDMTQNLNVDLMDSVQKIATTVEGAKPMVDENGNATGTVEAIAQITEKIFEDDKLLQGMAQMSSALAKSMEDSQLPVPPAFARLLNKVEE